QNRDLGRGSKNCVHESMIPTGWTCSFGATSTSPGSKPLSQPWEPSASFSPARPWPRAWSRESVGQHTLGAV
ncbi:hypothetical protein ScalyP_jg10819, partial [Parmales sp. scaly parma]